MRNKNRFAAACVMAVAAFAGAQDAAAPAAAAGAWPVVTLAGALAAASAAGDDFTIAAGALDLAEKQRDLDLARQGLSLGVSGAYALADGIGQDSDPSAALASYGQGVISRAVGASTGGSPSSSYNGIAQAPQGSLSLSAPLTKATLSVAHSIPVPQPAAPTVAPSSVVGLTLSQTLYDGYPGGQYRAALEKSLLALQGKRLSAAQGNAAATTKVKTAYMAMLAAQRDLDIKRRVLAKQETLLGQIRAIFAIKQATAIDLKTAQVNARIAGIDAKTAEKTLRLANERLAVMMGRGPGDRFSVADLSETPMPAASVDEAIDIGLQRRTDVAQLDLNAKSSMIDSAVTLAQAKPAISLTGGLGAAVGWLPTPVLAGAVSLGAKVAMPVYDSGAAGLQAKVSAGQAALYGLQAAQLRKTLASDIRDYFEGAQLLAEKVGLAKDSMDMADAQFALVQAQNRYGTATVQDVLTASIAAATAEVAYQTAKSAYLGAVLQLSTSMGL